MTESILSGFETSSANATNLKLFHLASGRCLGQGKKAVTFLTKITRTVSRPHTKILLSNLLSQNSKFKVT